MSVAETIDYTKVQKDDPRLWNIGELAKILGVNRSFVAKMCKGGFRMPLGKASVAMAHKFMEENPDI